MTGNLSNAGIQKKVFIAWYVLLAYIAGSLYFNYIDSADTIQYLELAKEYSKNGLFEHPNAYWSPLLSWLIAPFCWFKTNPVHALKLIQLSCGFILYIQVLNRLSTLKLPQSLNIPLSLVFPVIILSYALLYGTPDLLFLVLLMAIVKRLPQFTESIKKSIVLGLLGALLYFSKAAGFYLFILATGLVQLYHAFVIKNKNSLAPYLSCMGIFILISGVWIFSLSKHEHHLTISSAGKYNLNILSPAINPDLYAELQHPISKDTLMAPDPVCGSSSWMQPDKYQLNNWSPFSSSENSCWYGKNILRNFKSIRSFYFGLDAGTLIIVVLFLLFLFKKQAVLQLFKGYKYELITAISVSLFYCLVFVQPRYLWLNEVLLLLMAASTTRLIYQYKKTPAYLFLTAVLLLSIRVPLKEMGANADRGKALKVFIEQNALHGNLASVHAQQQDDYTSTNLVAYYTHSNYFGRLSADKNKEEENRLLLK